MHVGGSKSGASDLLAVLLQQREEDEQSDAEEEQSPQLFQAQHTDDMDDSDEDGPAEDPEAHRAEDADIQAQLRNANEVLLALSYASHANHMSSVQKAHLESKAHDSLV